MNIILTLIAAVIGGFIGLRLRIPAGALIGSIIASAIFNIITAKGFLPLNFRLAAQMVVGGYIGLSFSRNSLIQIKENIVPLVIMVASLFVFSILLGLLLYKITNIDLITALLGSAPGGLTEMAIIADSYGADISTVATMHLIRIMSVVIFLPAIMRKIIAFFFANQ